MTAHLVKGGICLPKQTFDEIQSLVRSGKYRSRNRLMVIAIQSYLSSEAAKAEVQNETPAA